MRNSVTTPIIIGDFRFLKRNLKGLLCNGRFGGRFGTGFCQNGIAVYRIAVAIRSAANFYAHIPAPGALEVGQPVTSGGFLRAHALHARHDFKGAQQARKLVSIDGTFGLPETVLQAAQPVQQEGGGEAVRIALSGKAEVDIFEKLTIVIEEEVIALIEDDIQCVADVGGPGAGDGIGELEERLDQLHAAGVDRGEASPELFFGVGRQLLKLLEMLLGPGREALPERFGFVLGGVEVEALYAVG